MKVLILLMLAAVSAHADTEIVAGRASAVFPFASVNINGIPTKLMGSTTYYDYTMVPTTTTVTSQAVVGFATYTFTAGSLNTAGACAIIECHTRLSGTGNTKLTHILLNGASLTSYSTTSGAAGVIAKAKICRQDATLMQWDAEFYRPTATLGTVDDQGSTSDALDYTAAVSLSCAGAGATANGDVSFRKMKVYYEP